MWRSRSFWFSASILAALLLTILLLQKRDTGIAPTATAPSPERTTADQPIKGAANQGEGASTAKTEAAIEAPPQAAAPGAPVPTYVVRANTAPPLPLRENFLDSILDPTRKQVRIPLPGGGSASGFVTALEEDKQGVSRISGRLTEPHAGVFFFLRQPLPNLAGTLVGHVLYDHETLAYRVFPSGVNQSPQLHQVTADDVACRQLLAREEPEEAPQNHPSPGTVPIPPSQNGVPPMQSLPGASAVVYLDYDGENGTWSDWNNGNPINAAPSGMSNNSIYESWRRISEDFLPFNINVTTIRSVYNAAPRSSRMYCIITPTDTAADGAGGVAYVGSFDWDTDDKTCWVFQLGGKSCAEAASHEIGHTLGLSHDGRTNPNEGYYGGHGDGSVGWAPIMGVGYYENLSQWSKGEYLNANQLQDDLNIIVSNNNNVDYRNEDATETFATAPYLDISSNGTVTSNVPGVNEGVIETRNDVDAFRFTTTGGNINLTINPGSVGPNLDILAEIVSNADGTVIATSNPDTNVNATFNTNLAEGDYILRISGVGRGDVLGDGYSDYGSLGAYLISGTVTGGVYRDAFSLAENTANGTSVGTVNARANHGAAALSYSIVSGNSNGAFNINSSTGQITVANSGALNFEALSTKWDDPATLELFVSITDDQSTASELIRTVITITNVNEAPVLPSLSPVSLPETTAVGTVVATVTASDPDRFDYVSYSITAGNAGGVFSIDDSGIIKTTTALTGASTFQLTIQALDHLTPANTVTTSLMVRTPRSIAIPPNTGLVLEPNTIHPGMGPYTYAWSKTNGAGNVTFGNANAASTTATFSASGPYTLELVTSNGVSNVIDEINVTAGAGPVAFNPVGTNFGTVTNSNYNYNAGTGTYTITGASAGIDQNANSDNFQCYGQTFTGDFDLKARVDASDVANSSSERVGLIVRSGTNANGISAFVGFDTTPTRWVYWITRASAGANNARTLLNQNWASAQSWARIVRTGNTVRGYYGSDGVNWQQSNTVNITGDVMAGLCWSSDSNTSGTATFTNVSLANSAPSFNVGAIVNAGADLPNVTTLSASLDGTVSDDGKPAAAIVTSTWSQISGPGTITFGDASLADTTATASVPGIYTLRLITNDTEIKTFDDVVVTFAATPWNSWQTNRFGGNAGNAAIASETADPDHDGIPNLLEYAFDTNPNSPTGNLFTQSIEEVGGQSYLRLTATKNPAATDLIYTIESSGDLSPTSWSNPANTVTIESNTATQIIGRDNTAVSPGNPRFLHLKVTRN